MDFVDDWLTIDCFYLRRETQKDHQIDSSYKKAWLYCRQIKWNAVLYEYRDYESNWRYEA